MEFPLVPSSSKDALPLRGTEMMRQIVSYDTTDSHRGLIVRIRPRGSFTETIKKLILRGRFFRYLKVFKHGKQRVP